MINEILEDLDGSMEGSIEALKREMSKRRTGRANVALLDGIRVDYYGSKSPLNQVASVKVADPRLITIKPWEKAMVQVIEKAILQSSLGLTPNSDGELIRIPIPPLTEERRRELVKEVKRLGEEAKVSLRGHRRDANEMLKDAEKDKEISEDEMHRAMAKVQEATDEFVKQVDALVADKEQEILEF
jgi:ribosome recycling factor